MRKLILLATALAVTIAIPATSTAAEAKPLPSKGCGTTPPASADQTIVSGGRTRSYRLHLPEGYQPGTPYPLILVFHGRGKSGAFTEQFSDMSKLNAVVAYPDGVLDAENKQAWQGAPYSVKGVDDVKFTADLLDQLEATTCVDRTAVYATGKSNGAGFTGILACTMADRFAAIAPVAGAFYRLTPQACTPSRPVPVLAIHGTGDATIPYDGDGARDLPAVQTWVRDWAVRDHCKPVPRISQQGDDVLTMTYGGCRGLAEVVHVAVTDGGHTWPGSDASSGPGYVTQTFEAHELIGRFFNEHRLNR